MNRNLIIDMSQAHLIPERVRKYALRVFDTARKYPTADRDAQTFYDLVQILDFYLSQESLDSPLFQKTNSVPDWHNGLVALRKGEENWQRFRYPAYYANSNEEKWRIRTLFPYFFFYVYDNELEQSDAISALLKFFDLDFPCTIPHTFSLPEQIPFPGNQFERIPYKEQYLKFMTTIFPGGKIVETGGLIKDQVLYNAQLLAKDVDSENPRPVFMIDNFFAAADLEKEVWHNHVFSLLRQLAEDLKEDGFLFSEDLFDNTAPYSWVKEPKNRNDYLKNLILSMGTPSCNSEYPLGDVIWVAPVGGYTTPWNTDFSPLNNRDVYIFKMNFQDRSAALKELLDVYSCLPKSDEKKIRFVMLERKTSSEVKDNAIDYMDINALFAQCGIYNVSIPENLMLEYDRYLRDTGKKRTSSHFIVEPFLRKNSWAMLTGEEGVGKSYIAMALGSAIAAKGTLFSNWRVPHGGNKVLYVVDDEMTDDILDERLRGLRRMYKKSGNFLVESVHALNLLEESGRKLVEKKIADAAGKGTSAMAVNVLILDHLLKLTDTHGAEKEEWPVIRRWIEELAQRGVSVLLLHHEYAGTKMMGSRLIANDAPARVHLARPEEPDPDPMNLTIGVSIPKNKGGKDQQTAKPVTLVLGKTPYWKEDGTTTTAVWKNILPEERTQTIKAQKKAGKTVGEIARYFNVSKSTVEKWITANLKKAEEEPQQQQ